MNSTRLSRKSSSSKSTVISSPILSPNSPLSPSASNSTVASSSALSSSFQSNILHNNSIINSNHLHHHASSPSLNFTSDHQVISSLARSFENHHPLTIKAIPPKSLPRQPSGHPTFVSLPSPPPQPPRRPHPIVLSQPIHHPLRASISHSHPPTPSHAPHARSPSPPPSASGGASRLRTVRTKILRSLTPTSLATRPASPDLTRSPPTNLGELAPPPRRASLRALCSRTPTPVARPATALADTPLYEPPPPPGRWKLLGGLRKRAPTSRWPPTPPPSASRRSSSGSTGDSRPPRALRPCSKSLTNMWFEAQQMSPARQQPDDEPAQILDEPQSFEEDGLAHAASRATKHWRRRQSPTEIALGRLDEILRGHHESVAESMTVARMVVGQTDQEEEETQRRIEAKEHRLTYYALSPPQRPRKKTTAKPLGAGQEGAGSTAARTDADGQAQPQTPTHKKVVIEPKVWEKISISASEQHSGPRTTTVGTAGGMGRRYRGGLVGWPATSDDGAGGGREEDLMRDEGCGGTSVVEGGLGVGEVVRDGAGNESVLSNQN